MEMCSAGCRSFQHHVCFLGPWISSRLSLSQQMVCVPHTLFLLLLAGDSPSFCLIHSLAFLLGQAPLPSAHHQPINKHVSVQRGISPTSHPSHQTSEGPRCHLGRGWAEDSLTPYTPLQPISPAHCLLQIIELEGEC